MGTLITAIYGEILAQKDRLFLWLPVFFGVGITLYFTLPAEPPLIASVFPLLFLIPCVIYGWRRQHDSRAHLILYFTVCTGLMVAAGFGGAKMATHLYGTPILKKEQTARIIGVIEHIENLGGSDGSRAVIGDVAIERVAAEDTPRKIRVRIRRDDGLQAGQTISFLGRISPTSPPVAPGSYDFQRHLFFEGIGAVGFSYDTPVIIEEKNRNMVGVFFDRMRAEIFQNIEARGSGTTAGIMTALITGQRGAIEEEDDEAMRASGLYHLLSISGAHVGMVAATIFFFSRFVMAAFPWFAIHYPIKKIAAAIALSGAVFYCILAGADVPAQRAAMMTGLVLVAIMLDRSPLSLRLIAFAALMVLITLPQSLIGVSFQMSFAAVAGLICFFEYINPQWTGLYSRAGWIRKGALYMAGLIITSVIAGALTGLFGLYHFQQFAVYGVLSNMIAVPITGIVIMPAAICALILMPFGWEGPALTVMEWGTIWMLAVAHWTAGLDGAVIHVQQWPQITFAFLCAGVVLGLIWRGWAGKGLALSLIVMGLVFTAFNKQPDMLVSDGGKLIAVRGTDDDLYFSSTRKEKFVAENWLRLSGREGERPKSFTDPAFPHLCDGHGCRIVRDDVKIALSFDHQAWREDCAWADVLIAQVPVQKRACPETARVFDFFDFRRGGAHAFYFEDGLRVRSVARERGQRPWVR